MTWFKASLAIVVAVQLADAMYAWFPYTPAESGYSEADRRDMDALVSKSIPMTEREKNKAILYLFNN